MPRANRDIICRNMSGMSRIAATSRSFCSSFLKIANVGGIGYMRPSG